ncbi:unnamed protein product [Closterium sp. NIES-54]
MTTLRVLQHVAAQLDYELHSLDFSTTFLQGSLHEEISLRHPSDLTGSFPPSTQWSLRRPVYGLRQAPGQWHHTLRTTLAALGFAPTTTDPSLFLRYFQLHLFAAVLHPRVRRRLGLCHYHVKSELQKRHTCTDLDELRSYLGLQITRDKARRTITLTQSHMVQQVLQRFDFTYSSPQATPLSTRHSLSALPSDESIEPSGPYIELVGCLMYLKTCTRPDHAYPLSILARYVAPGRHHPEHMAAAKRVLRYLCSYARSSLGYTFSLGSGSVLWRSTRSSSVLGSSCEAEIYAGAMAAQELRWLTYMLFIHSSFFHTPAPPDSSLPEVPDPESYRARATSPTVSRLLATAVTDPSFEYPAASALVAELLDFAAACRLYYATALVDEQDDFEFLAAALPRFASLLLAPKGDPDAPDIPTPRSYAEAITGPYSSQWQAAMDAEMASLKSTCTYVDEVPPPRASIVVGMWIFRVKRPLGSSLAFMARRVARGFNQRQGVDYFQTFSPTPKITTLRVLLHVAAQDDYKLHSLDFSTAFLQSSLHEEI